MITLVYADTGDWVAIYRDGVLVEQGHSFQEDRLLALVGVEYEVRSDVDPEPTGWQFPSTLAELDAAHEETSGST